MARAIIETYGCTLNRADSDMMENMLKSSGVEVESGRLRSGDSPDFVIINTCTVKTPTEQRILDRIRKISSGNSRIIVTGCMASSNPDRIRKVAPHASIVTTSNVHRIGSALDELKIKKSVNYSNYSKNDKLEHHVPIDGVIARIPISEGCLSGCSFCETKFARGPLNSFSDKLILKAIEMNVKKGAREIELTSQDVGAYGLDRETNIAELLVDSQRIEGDFRIRVGMLNPEHLHKYIDRLVEGLKNRNVYKFLHLPLQSASNRVLRDMERRSTIEQFCDHVEELRLKVPGISIETDMIVGYPTETEEDFTRSMEFICNVRPTFTNVSKFGARPHAKASRLKQLGNDVIKERSSKMSRLARAVQREDLSKFVNEKESILITEQNNRSLIGRDDCYRVVALDRHVCTAKIGDRIGAKITGNTSVCLLGMACD